MNNLQKNYFLIDLVTFNCITLKDINDQNLFDISLESYKKDISLCENFEETYLLVDYDFMSNFCNIVKESILKRYKINIYMFENYYFMIYLKRDSTIIESEIKFYKNKCLNPMLVKESERLSVNEVEEFINNYYNLIIVRDFFEENVEHYKTDETFLFDFKNKVNYILDLVNKPNEKKITITNEENNIKEDNFYVEILSTKNEFNKYHDILEESFINGFNYKNIIFVRKTEFNEQFEEKRIESIIKYLFRIKDIKINDKSYKENKLSISNTGINYGNDTLIKISENNNSLPFLLQSNKEINPKQVALIEYEYFLSQPLLLPKKVNKPNILILANDFGILNYYYNAWYQKLLNIISFMEKNILLVNKIFLKLIMTALK